MKKLLIATDTYFPKRDGVMVFLQEVIPSLTKHFDVTIAAPIFSSKDFKQIPHTRLVGFDTSSTINLAGYNSINLSRENFRKMKNLVKESDIIWSQDLALIGALAIKYGRRYKKPVVNYVHQITWEHVVDLFSMPEWLKRFFAFIIRWVVKRLYNKCTLLMVPYRNLARQLEKKGIKTRMSVVRLGVNSQRFYPAFSKENAKKKIGISPDMRVIGYCGRISKEKNLGVLINAYEQISKSRKDVFLLIVGGGDKSEIEKFSNLPNCRITGFVDNVVPYLQAIDIFVMPSLTETTSLATLEAMSCGLAVVSTKVGYIKEYLIDKYNGVFFPEDNPYLLKLKLEKLIRNDKLRARLGKNAHELITSKFSWQRTTDGVIKILSKL